MENRKKLTPTLASQQGAIVPVGMGRGGKGYTGRDLWRSLFDSALKLGVRFQPASWVEVLITDDRGDIRGVRYRCLDTSAPVASFFFQVVFGGGEGVRGEFSAHG